MDKKISQIITDIKKIKIQGARNVARAVVTAIILQVKNSKAKTFDELYSELLIVSDLLASTRPTEPMMRNSIKDVINFTVMQISSGNKSIDEVKKNIVEHSEKYLKKMEHDSQILADYGAKTIENGSLVITYCHSSTVTGILKKAFEIGTDFRVICCETRPKFQGRITAKELSSAGIDTTLVVDGASNVFMKKADLCLVGADAITSTGDLINKIGTSCLAQISRIHNVSFYCAAELYKYNPLTLYGNKEKIEQRSPKEIWETPPKKLKIENPAFDFTEARYINGYITEEGIISPTSFSSVATRHFKELG
ncbi:MAG: S-methyl-5-thioribose-1-phosphate isomerase [Candidatus Micrarchaeia archaeon]